MKCFSPPHAFKNGKPLKITNARKNDVHFHKGSSHSGELGNAVWWCRGSRAELSCRGAVGWAEEGASQGFGQGKEPARALGWFWASTQHEQALGKGWGLRGEGDRRAQGSPCTPRSELSSQSSQHQLLVLPVLGEGAALPGGEWVKSLDFQSVLLAAGLQRNELEAVGIIIVDDLLCGNGLKASCFLSRS